MPTHAYQYGAANMALTSAKATQKRFFHELGYTGAKVCLCLSGLVPVCLHCYYCSLFPLTLFFSQLKFMLRHTAISKDLLFEEHEVTRLRQLRHEVRYLAGQPPHACMIIVTCPSYIILIILSHDDAIGARGCRRQGQGS